MHVFAVRAKDTEGHVSNPALRSWSVVLDSFSGPVGAGQGTGHAAIEGGGANCGFDTGQTGFIAATNPPTGVTLPNGLFQFRLVGCDPGGTVTLRVRWPGQAGGQYWKYNPRTSQWYPYPGAFFNPFTSTWTLQITDNGPHDADPTPGVILDPTGPAQRLGTGPGDPGNPGAGAQPIPTLSQWMLGALAGLLGLLVLGAHRRRVGG